MNPCKTDLVETLNFIIVHCKRWMDKNIWSLYLDRFCTTKLWTNLFKRHNEPLICVSRCYKNYYNRPWRGHSWRMGGSPQPYIKIKSADTLCHIFTYSMSSTLDPLSREITNGTYKMVYISFCHYVYVLRVVCETMYLWKMWKSVGKFYHFP